MVRAKEFGYNIWWWVGEHPDQFERDHSEKFSAELVGSSGNIASHVVAARAIPRTANNILSIV